MAVLLTVFDSIKLSSHLINLGQRVPEQTYDTTGNEGQKYVCVNFLRIWLLNKIEIT